MKQLGGQKHSLKIQVSLGGSSDISLENRLLICSHTINKELFKNRESVKTIIRNPD